MDLSVKKIGSIVACRIGLPLAFARIKSSILGSEAVVLMYHRVSPDGPNWLLEPCVTPRAFETQIQYLRTRYEILSLHDFFERAVQTETDHPIASITFDDGYKDNFTDALPLLRKYRLPATVFLATGPIETRSLFWWDKIGFALINSAKPELTLSTVGEFRLGDIESRRIVSRKIVAKLKGLPDPRKNQLIDSLILDSGVSIGEDVVERTLLDWEEARVMADSGIAFGAHSVSHPMMVNISNDQAICEIRESKDAIERRVAQKADFFAYPNGAFNVDIAQMVKSAGFIGAVTVKRDWITHETDPFAIGRLGVSWDDSDMFRVLLSGLY